jgi:very-short-patch-repair endonuclease
MKRDKSHLFVNYWRLLGDERQLITEYRFHWQRKWRFDIAFVKEQVAVEVEGGVYQYGRHNRASGYLKDIDKYNTAAALGWRLLRFTPDMLENNPSACIALVLHALNQTYPQPVKLRVVSVKGGYELVNGKGATVQTAQPLKTLNDVKAVAADGKVNGKKPNRYIWCYVKELLSN